MKKATKTKRTQRRRPGRVRAFSASLPDAAARASTLRPGAASARRQEMAATFMRAFEHVPVGIAHNDFEGRFLRVNRKLSEMLGYSAEELLGKSIMELSHPEDRGSQHRAVLDVIEGRSDSLSGERRLLRKDGSVVWVNRTMTLAGAASDAESYLIQVIEDITERKRNEARIARLNHARLVMAACTMAIVRAATEPELFQEICRHLVESGGYRQAWIGLAVDDAAKSIRISGAAGYEPGYIESRALTWGSDVGRQGVMGSVIASGKPCIAQNILAEERFSRRRVRALEKGYQSSITLPLKVDGCCIGGISIYADEADAFDPEEIALLTVLADDIAFGVASLRTRIAREHAETRLREHERRYRETFEQAAVGITRVDLNGVLVDANQKFCDMLGYAKDELLGKAITDITHPDDYGQGSQYRRQLAHGVMTSATGEKRFIRKDGTIMWARRTMSAAGGDAMDSQYVISVVEDITERKELERRFELTFDRAAVGMALGDLDGRYLLVNQRFADMLGYSREELKGRAVLDLVLSEEHAEIGRLRKKLLSGEVDSTTDERRYIRKDGRVIWTRRTLSLARDSTGTPLYFIGVAEDITASKEREERYRTIFANAAVGITHVDLEGILVDVNQKFCDMLGYAKDELLGKAIKDITYPDDYAQGFRYRAQLAQGAAKSAGGEKRFVRKDGTIIWARRTISAAFDDAGKPQYLISVVEDITERKQAEQALRDGEERYRNMFELAPLPLLVMDEATLRFLAANRAAVEKYGYAHDEFLSMTILDLQLEEDRANVAQQLRQRDPHKSVVFQRRHATKNGEVILAEVTARPFVFHGRQSRILLVNDITERRRAEAALQESEEQLRAMFNQASVGITVSALDLRYVQVNEKFCDIVGYSRDELLQMSVTDVNLPDSMEGAIEHRRRLFAGEIRSTVREKQLLRKDGSPVWVSMATSVIRDNSGEPKYFISVIQDISERKRAESALQESEEQFRQLAGNIPQAFWISDVTQRRTLYMSPAAETLIGRPLREINADRRTLIRAVHEEDRPRLYAARKAAAGGGYDETYRIVRPDGSIRWVHDRAFPVRDGAGNIYRIAGIAEDITERRRAEDALRESEEQFRQLAGNIPQVFWITDVRQRELIYVSPAYERITGRPLEPLKVNARDWLNIVHEEDRERVKAARKTVLSAQYDEVFRVVRPDGTIRWVRDRAFPVRDAEGKVYRITGIAEDITERREAEERLKYLAHYDALTSLPNRVLFYDRLKQELAHARRNNWVVAVMFIDLDRFKNVNDTLGHGAGDRLLRQVSERLVECVRTGDTVGRLGGDEFAIVLSNIGGPRDASVVAQKIMAALGDPFQLQRNEVFITASIGITLFPTDSRDQDTLIRNADTAMYRAKELGRNSCQFYTPEMNARALEKLSLESSLRRALERREFVLYFQPKVSLVTGEITGVEALLRWRHPELGLVSPADFMLMLEETGLIVPTGEWVIRAACAQIRSWQQAGIKPVPVAVNLSARQFQARDLSATISRILEEERVRHDLLELEITESSIANNTEEAAETLAFLNALGVRVAIDDFGTGHSSLSRLKRFPLDALKIDSSFVRDITTDADDAAITRAIITMAHSLGLAVVAEGVETEQQLNFLSANGCDEIQGYYFSTPLSAEDCTALIQSGRRLQLPGQSALVEPLAALPGR